jgi:hypothetical protein
LPDGTVVDATADQFEERWLGARMAEAREYRATG